jgi:hypothetical protein
MDGSNLDLSKWILKDRLSRAIGSDPALGLEDMIFGTPAPTPSPAEATTFDSLETFLQSLVEEQLKRPSDLLTLNPSRRESLGRFLSELSRLPEPEQAQEALKSFVRSDRTESEHEALKQLFKQIAIVQIAKALLVLSWRRKSGVELAKSDLKDLTAAISRELGKYIHLQTSSCQLIQRNFYSWYKMSDEAQQRLLSILQSVSRLDDARNWLLSRARCLSAETLGERERYSNAVYAHLWKSASKHELLNSRSDSLIGFSPTLRDGSLMESAASNIEWIGFEPLSFELLFCEVRYLWNEPKCPPLWLKGTGIEMNMEQQKDLLLTASGKQNILRQMDSVTCADVALIAEESLIRTQGRSLAAQALRKSVDQHPVLKKLKQPSTTRGMYQACQAVDKLRQGGTLIWMREELLTEASGKPALQFLLDQASILLIADLSGLQSTSDQLKRDIPKALYVLRKENRLEERKGHRPILIKAFGSIETDADAALLFDRLISLIRKPEQVFPPEPFHLRTRVSPMDQREWEQHWFNPNDDQMVAQIETLKRNSDPFGQFATIRTLPLPAMGTSSTWYDPANGGRTPGGFYVWVESSKNGNELFTATESRLPAYVKGMPSLFFVSPLRQEWGLPLQAILRSPLARDWFEYSIERKKGAWVLKESDLKAVPIPRHLTRALIAERPELSELDPKEAKVLGKISTEPHQALKAIENEPELKARAFIHAASVLEHLDEHQGSLFKMISPDEQLIYPRLFDTVLTEQDLCGIHQHPHIRYTPTLSVHQAIRSISVLKVPAPGILLTTPRGLTQMLYVQDAWLLERCLEAIEELRQGNAEPTWGEIMKTIRLPRNPEQARAMGNQILKAYSTEKMRRKELIHLMGVCLMPEQELAGKVGLLQ